MRAAAASCRIAGLSAVHGTLLQSLPEVILACPDGSPYWLYNLFIFSSLEYF